MKTLTKRIGTSSGRYDMVTDKDCPIIHSIDLTDDCPKLAHKKGKKREAFVVDYIQDRNGIKVLVNLFYPGENYGGHVLNTISQISGNLYTDSTYHFCGYARRAGLTPNELAEIVRREAPKVDVERLVQDIRTSYRKPKMPMSQVRQLIRELGENAVGFA